MCQHVLLFISVFLFPCAYSSPITNPFRADGNIDKIIPDYLDIKKFRSFHNATPISLPNIQSLHVPHSDSCHVDFHLRLVVINYYYYRFSYLEKDGQHQSVLLFMPHPWYFQLVVMEKRGFLLIHFISLLKSLATMALNHGDGLSALKSLQFKGVHYYMSTYKLKHKHKY